MVKVYIEKEDKYENVEGNSVDEILKKLEINPTTVMVTKNNELVVGESEIKEGDEVKIIPVISGG